MKINNQLLPEIFIMLLTMLWVYAAVSKLADFKIFTLQLRLQPFGEIGADFLRFLLPISEITIAGLLSFKFSRKLGLCISLGLLLLFTIYIAAIILHFFSNIPCSCGGILGRLGWHHHLIFNLGFLAINIYALLTERKEDIGNK
jgi:putative oxidoreductase